MKKAAAVILVFLTVVLESTLMIRFRIRGIAPNLSLVLVISYGLLEGHRWGRNIGLLIGLAQDVLFCPYIGFYALLYFYLGHLSGYGHAIFRKTNLMVPTLLIIAGDVVYGFLCYFFKYFMAGEIEVGYYISQIIVPEAAYTALWVLPCYCAVAIINRRLTRLPDKDTITQRMYGEVVSVKKGSKS